MPVLTHKGQINKGNKDLIIQNTNENTKLKFKNSSGNNVIWNFPTTLGTVDQILKISSVIRDDPIVNSSLTNVNNLTWGTGGGGGSSNLSGLDDTTISSLQSGDLLIYNSDATWHNVSLSGDATIASNGSLTIATDAIHSNMLNDDIISGQTNMSGDVDDNDELLISDGGTLKRIDFSVLRDAVFNDVSGDATISSGSLSISSNIALTGTPTAPTANLGTSTTQIATTAFVSSSVDTAAEGLHVLSSCRVATTANITLSGTQTIDGVVLVADERVLVKDQGTASQNGIYLCKSGSWTRTTDFDSSSEIVAGDFVFVTEGSVNGGHGFVMISAVSTLGGDGGDAINWTQFSGIGQVIAGEGITITDHTIDCELATNSNKGIASFTNDFNVNNGVVSITTLNQNTTGNAQTATALESSRNIGGVAFDGTSNINLPGVNTSGTQNTSGSAATVTGAAQTAITSVGTLTGLTVGALTFPNSDGSADDFLQTDGSGNLSLATISLSDLSDITAFDTSSLLIGGSISGTTNANRNIGFGVGVFENLTTGDSNTGIGAESLKRVTTGSGNTALGDNSMLYLTTGQYNVSIGQHALFGSTSNFTGTSNVAIGSSSLRNSESGDNNTALGFSAGRGITTGNNNVSIGMSSLYSCSGTVTDTISIGRRSLYNVESNNNIALGSRSQENKTTGNPNISIGYMSLCDTTTGGNNIAIGDNSQKYITTGEKNICIGNHSGFNTTTGEKNICIGYYASCSSTQSNSILIGSWTSASVPAALDDNTVVIGNTDTNKWIPAYNYSGSSGVDLGSSSYKFKDGYFGGNLLVNGTFSDGNYTFDTSGNVSGLGTVSCGAITSNGNLAITGTITGDTSLTLDSTTVTTSELGFLENVTAGTAVAGKALVLDSNKDIASIRNLTITDQPTNANYAANKSYVDAFAEGLHILEPCLVGTISNISGTYSHGSADGIDYNSTLSISSIPASGNLSKTGIRSYSPISTNDYYNTYTAAVTNFTVQSTGLTEHDTVINLSSNPSQTIIVGMRVFGVSQIPDNTVITVVTSQTQFTISNSFTGNATNPVLTLSSTVIAENYMTPSGSNKTALFKVNNTSSGTTVSCIRSGYGYTSGNLTFNNSSQDQNENTLTGFNGTVTITISSDNLVHQIDGIETTYVGATNVNDNIIKTSTTESLANRIFIKNQSNLNENGIYYISTPPPRTSFYVTVISGVFYIDGVSSSTTVNLKVNTTYIFYQSDSSNANHPYRFSTTSNGSHATPEGTEFTTGVTPNGTPGSAGAYTQIVTGSSSTTLYSYCTNHSNMGGTISITTGSETDCAFTRTSDVNSMFVKDDSTHNVGDIRPGDYSYILQGAHGMNKNHSFVFSNEHMGLTSGSWTGASTTDHTNANAIVVTAFSGAETIHVDNETIELSSSDRHLQVKDLGITGTKIADNSITTDKITDANVTTAKIADNAVTLAKLENAAANTVLVRNSNTAGVPSFEAVANTEILIGNGSGFTSSTLRGDVAMTNSGAVTIASNAVTTAKIADANVTTAKIEDNAITSDKIADNAINSEHYTDGSIDTAHIADSQITNIKLAGSITDSKLSTITTADKVSGSAVQLSSTSAIENSTGLRLKSTLGGTGLTLSNNQVLSIDDNAITTNKIINDAITGDKIADNAINSEHYTDGSIDSVHIANDAVTYDKIAGATSIISSSLTYVLTATGANANSSVGWATLANVCFLKGTKITMSDYSEKYIEDLTLDDDVLTYKINELDDIRKKEEIIKWNKETITGKFSESGIRNIWINPTDSYLIINDILNVTPGHIMFFRRNNIYYLSHAVNLIIGDELMKSYGNFEIIKTIKLIEEEINVYNFEVDKDSTYFAEDYLVHHMCELCSGYSKIL